MSQYMSVINKQENKRNKIKKNYEGFLKKNVFDSSLVMCQNAFGTCLSISLSMSLSPYLLIYLLLIWAYQVTEQPCPQVF